MLQPLPGQVWSHQISDSSMLSVIRVVVPCHPTRHVPDHYVLLLDNRPVRPPFKWLTHAVAYAVEEWLPLGHREISR